MEGWLRRRGLEVKDAKKGGEMQRLGLGANETYLQKKVLDAKEEWMER